MWYTFDGNGTSHRHKSYDMELGELLCCLPCVVLNVFLTDFCALGSVAALEETSLPLLCLTGSQRARWTVFSSIGGHITHIVEKQSVSQ
jgi:hypothetical protein